jgi:alpha-tubulin suppressor-like RCC1 family protein/outer membrane protein OmpA-like peptidoglycan-associated protein
MVLFTRRALALSFLVLASAIGVVAPMSSTPVQASILIQDPSTPSKITGGDGFLCLIVNGGAVECSGLNDQGQLGDGTNTNRSYSRPITSDGKISSPTGLAVGKSHACAVSGGGSSGPGSGKLYCWGDNQFGQLGNGTNIDSSLPVLVSDNAAFVNTSVAGVFAGDNHTCAITLAPTNRVFCWGYNNKGQLGDNTTADKNLPAAVLGVFTSTGTVAEANFYPWATAGAEHTCAVSTANTNKIYCWGENGSGQLGDGSTTDSLLPVATVMTGGSGSSTRTSFIAAGRDFTCATDAGSIKCWGENGSGQMGNGGTTDVLAPTMVPNSAGFINAAASSVAAGGGTVCAISEASAAPELFCWGANAARQVGNNATVDANRPTLVTDNSAQEFDNGGGSATNANGLTVGRSVANGFACITRWCWGSNNAGQLAQNNTTDVTLASKIKRGVTVADDVTGFTVSAVLKSTGLEVSFTGVPATGLAMLDVIVAPATHVLAPNQIGGPGTTSYGPKRFIGSLPTVSGGQVTVLVPAMASGANSISGPPTYASTPFVKGVSYHLTYSVGGNAATGYPDGWRIRNGVTTGTELVATIDSSFAADAASGSSSSTTTTPATPATSTTVAPGAAATTGSAAGVGNYATAVPGITVTDAKVYTTAPQEVAGNSAIAVLTPAQNKVMDVVSKTPSICLPNDDDLVFLDEGKCIAEVVNVKTRKVLRTLRTTVVEDDIADLKVGNEIAILTPLYFHSGTTNFKDASLARLAKLRSRINAAGSILIAGHSGTLTGNTPENVKLSQQRAAVTVKELKSRGAKGPFAIAAVGALDPATNGKTQASQEKNRRVVLVLIP